MKSGPKKPKYGEPPKKRAGRDPRDPTRMVTNPGKPQAVSPLAADFDLDIEVSDLGVSPLKEADPESVTDVSDFFGDEDEPTLEVSAFNEMRSDDESTRAAKPGAKPRNEVVAVPEYQLQAPPPPVDLQPLYRPAIGDDGGPIAEPVETLSMPDLSDRKGGGQDDSETGGLFDNMSEEKSMPTVAVAPPTRAKPAPPPPPPVDGLSSGLPQKHRFASGVTAGMQPLDISRFDGQAQAPRNKKQTPPGTAFEHREDPLPMSRGQRIKRRNIGLQEILLVVLVIMLGVASWIGYKIYKSHRMEMEAAALDVSREQFQHMKDDAIESNKKKRNRDNP